MMRGAHRFTSTQYKSCAQFDFGNSTVHHDWLVNGTEITTANQNVRYKERNTTYDIVVNPARASDAGVTAIFSVGQPERKAVAVGSKLSLRLPRLVLQQIVFASPRSSRYSRLHILVKFRVRVVR